MVDNNKTVCQLKSGNAQMFKGETSLLTILYQYFLIHQFLANILPGNRAMKTKNFKKDNLVIIKSRNSAI